MSKHYDLYCSKHGRIHIEVERPPTFSRLVYCPWCAQRLTQPDKDAKRKWQPNLIREGASP